ncbi:hypothetical protein ES695_14590 [Candidatus Atribacteria bacterium 1244-E10-H5-B2]|nr:MAG: hypothetical protein ES695_14590 [Candidatus Atribacteria bacterium 1244-E10-H5-B2]
MPKYLCPKCKGVFYGWAMKYKYKGKCPDCGSELQEVYDDNRESRRDPIVKLSKTRKNLKKR